MKYAIIESGGKQYKSVEGETIDVDRLVVEPGTELKLDQVLLMVEGDNVSIGTPTISGISVLAQVLAHIKGEKLTVFKYRPKKRIRVKTGHRQTYTRLLIEQIGNTKAEKVAKVEKVTNAEVVSKLEKVAKIKKTEKIEKPVKEKKPAVEKITKAVKATPVKKVATTAKTDKKPAVKKTSKTDKKPAVKKTSKTEK